MSVHNHPPYRPVCNERRLPDGSLRGACLPDGPAAWHCSGCEWRSWWVINGGAFLDALRRSHAGEDPDLLYAEHYANSDQEDHR